MQTVKNIILFFSIAVIVSVIFILKYNIEKNILINDFIKSGIERKAIVYDKKKTGKNLNGKKDKNFIYTVFYDSENSKKLYKTFVFDNLKLELPADYVTYESNRYIKDSDYNVIEILKEYDVLFIKNKQKDNIIFKFVYLREKNKIIPVYILAFFLFTAGLSGIIFLKRTIDEIKYE